MWICKLHACMHLCMGGIVGTYGRDHWDIWEGSLGHMGGIVGTGGIIGMYGRDRWDIWEGSLGHMGGIVGTYEKDHWDIWEGSLGRLGGEEEGGAFFVINIPLLCSFSTVAVPYDMIIIYFVCVCGYKG